MDSILITDIDFLLRVKLPEPAQTENENCFGFTTNRQERLVRELYGDRILDDPLIFDFRMI